MLSSLLRNRSTGLGAAVAHATALTNQLKAGFCIAPRERSRYFIVEYEYPTDFYYKRIPFRDAHMQWVKTIEDRGNQIVGGSVFPLDGAIMIVNCDDRSIVDNFIAKDPYHKEGLVSKYSVTEIERQTADELQEVSKVFAYK